MSEIELRDAVFIPPPGCALNGMTRHKDERHLLLITPCSRGRLLSFGRRAWQCA